MISILENTHNFETKTFIDVLVIDVFLSYLRPKNSCEIGMHNGDTLQVIDHHSQKTYGVDVKFRKKLKSRKFKNIVMVHADKKNDTNLLYDFVHVDGDHSYRYVYDDLMFSQKHSHQNTVIIVDDYYNPNYPEVNKATNDFLEKSNFRITVKGHNQVFLEQAKPSKVKNIIETCFKQRLKQFCKYSSTDNSYSDATGSMPPESKLYMTARILQDATV